MSHEERMQQLGRRATQQEPAALALPRMVQASESVKPVSCVRHRIERHGWGEGRLPIPAAVSVRTGEELDAQRHQLSVQRDVTGPRSSPALKPQAVGSPVRQQANPQLDAIKARVSAAKAFSQALMQHNARQQQQQQSARCSSSSSQGKAGLRCSSAGRQAAGAVALLQAPAPKQPLVERHIPRNKGAAQAVQQPEEQQDAAVGAVPLPAGPPDANQLSAQVSRSSVAAAGTGAQAAADADVATAAASGQAAGQQVFDSAAATCRLVAFTQAADASHGSVAAAAVAQQLAAAGGTAQQHQQRRRAQPWGPPAAAVPGSPAARPASSTTGSPHWSPVPPRMQLQQPRVVRPMHTHAADGQHEAGAAGQQPLDSSSSTCRSRRVSLSLASPAAAAAGGELLQAQSSRRSAVGRASAAPAGFSNPELAQLAAAAAQQVAKHRLVLPALCACGHGASVLDPHSYSQRCCSNCPLHGDAAAHERLLLGLLSSMLL